MAMRVTAASAPPASITSARPARMCSAASPMAWLPEEQAVVAQESGPRRPSSIETWAAAMLAIIMGMNRGETRSGPRSTSTRVWASKVSRPPTPLPRITPSAVRDAVDLEPGVVQRHAPGGHAELGEAVHAPRRALLDVVRRLEALDLAGERGGVVHGVEVGDRPGAAPAGHGRGPDLLPADPDRRDQPEAGDHHPAGRRALAAHIDSPPSMGTTAPGDVARRRASTGRRRPRPRPPACRAARAASARAGARGGRG